MQFERRAIGRGQRKLCRAANKPARGKECDSKAFSVLLLNVANGALDTASKSEPRFHFEFLSGRALPVKQQGLEHSLKILETSLSAAAQMLLNTFSEIAIHFRKFRGQFVN